MLCLSDNVTDTCGGKRRTAVVFTAVVGLETVKYFSSEGDTTVAACVPLADTTSSSTAGDRLKNKVQHYNTAAVKTFMHT